MEEPAHVALVQVQAYFDTVPSPYEATFCYFPCDPLSMVVMGWFPINISIESS